MEDMTAVIFEIITLAGMAKSLAYEALDAAENGNFEQASTLMEEADEYILKSHRVQADLIKAETEGNGSDVTLLMVHAQDHLMSALEAKSLIEVMIRMFKRF